MDKKKFPNYIVCIENYKNEFTKGKVYKLDKNNEYHRNLAPWKTSILANSWISVIADDRNEPNGWSGVNFRLLTKEELEVINALYE